MIQMMDRVSKPGYMRTHNESGDWKLAEHVINQSRIGWALGTFKPFKSGGTNGIVPVLLQQGMEHLVPHLCRIFRACIAYEFFPTSWRQVKVTFIPKPGKLDHTEVNVYCPVSLPRSYVKQWRTSG
jgi:hypothetical protein